MRGSQPVEVPARRREYVVESVEAKPVKRNPSPPFTTSTLQQAASSKLGFSASRTMQVAQKLYEGVDIGGETVGLITYMRTDGVQMAPKRSRPRARPSAASSESVIFRKSRASIPPRQRMPRKRTRPFARPISTARPTRSGASSTATC